VIAALQAEWRKWRTTRLWWILLIVMAVYMAFIGAVLAVSSTFGSAISPGMPTLVGEAVAVSVYASGNGLGYVFPLLVGALAMTSEFRYQTITPSLLVQPNRWTFLATSSSSPSP